MLSSVPIKILFFNFIIILQTIPIDAQIQKSNFQYAVSPEQPYGAYNPKAQEQLKKFDPISGSIFCESLQRHNREQLPHLFQHQ